MKIKKILHSTTATIIATSIFRLLSIQALTNRRLNVSDTKFFLYNRSNRNKYVELSSELVKNNTTKYFNRHLFNNKKLIVLTHGWMADGFASSTQMLKNAYLQASDVNVIIVDWTNAASLNNYLVSAYMTDTIAKKIKDFLLSITTAWDLDSNNIHLIGHSLGAHILGVAGKMLRNDKVVIARMTGIDPARHFFEWPKYFQGIDKESAAFVDIIHTSKGAIGYTGNAGHVDFYPNGGLRHPHCCFLSNILAMTCEHSCGYIYYTETILGTNYTAHKCDSYASYQQGKCNQNDVQVMGEPCSQYASGVYYLTIE